MHATKPRTGTATAEAEPLERELLSSLEALIRQMRHDMHRALAPLDLPGPCARALSAIDGTISMRDLGKRLECDPSFVTAIADGLETRGLVVREVDQADRRVKNLVLTAHGQHVRAQLNYEFFGNLVRIHNLSTAEQRTLLG